MKKIKIYCLTIRLNFVRYCGSLLHSKLMVKIKYYLKRFFYFASLLLIIIVGAGILTTTLYKDELINHFIREANKSLQTPVNVGKIEISSLKNFPDFTVTFQDVTVQESIPNSSSSVLRAQFLSLTINPFDFYRGNYQIKNIILENGALHLKVLEDGTNNYTVFKKSEKKSADKSLALKGIRLKNVKFDYLSEPSDIQISSTFETCFADLTLENTTYSIQSDGKAHVSTITNKGLPLLEDKMIGFNTDLVYNDLKKHLIIEPSKLSIKNSAFTTSGTYDFLETPTINIGLEGENTNIQTLLSILPDSFSDPLLKYRSDGSVYFNLRLQGTFEKSKSPGLEIRFGLENSEVQYPETGTTITGANAEGTFTMTDISNSATAAVYLKNVKGELNNHTFDGELSYINFKDPRVDLTFSGNLEMNSVLSLAPSKLINSAKGEITADIQFSGRLNDLKKKATATRVNATGEIVFNTVDLNIDQLKLPFTGLEGNFLFNKNELAMTDFSGKLGNSDFRLNGYFKNIVAYLLFENEPIGIDADLKSDFIDLDELLTTQDASDETQYAFSISPDLILKFNCDVDHLQFRRFKPKNIKGDLKIKNKIAFAERLSFQAAGGDAVLSGMADASNDKVIRLTTAFSLNKIMLDSAFYVFENFNQDFLEDRHLKGQLIADVDTEMAFDNHLNLFSETLKANISTSIIGGELNNFEPMQQLARYVDAKELNHLVFSELRNDIHIEDKTIYLPLMEVKSNITSLQISGTHTFDQKIDYRIITPLRNRNNIDPDASFGAVEEDRSGQSMLYLKIVGTTSNYDVLYDKEAVKQKIISDLKKEVNELKEAFKNKGKKSTTIQLKEDDYFDWDN